MTDLWSHAAIEFERLADHPHGASLADVLADIARCGDTDVWSGPVAYRCLALLAHDRMAVETLRDDLRMASRRCAAAHAIITGTATPW